MVLKKALGEAAEALRRLFGTPKVHGLVAPTLEAAGRGGALFTATPRPALDPLSVAPREEPLLPAAAPMTDLQPFTVRLQVEEGWAAWDAGAEVSSMDLFRPGGAARMAVPPLPPGRAQRLPIPAPKAPETQALTPKVAQPRAFRIPAQAFQLEVRRDLGPALRRPFAFDSEEVQKLPKALWMRYSLALVKATGENVRNLEVLGLWRVPRKGVSGLRPDAGGRLWVQLGPEAVGADRAAFMVARKKDDQTLLSVFVE